MKEYGPVGDLVARLARAHAKAALPLLRGCGLHPGQELLLMCLWEEDHQSQTSLARTLRLDPSTVTRSLQRMERQGLLTRRSSPADRRAMVVSLASGGLALRPGVERAWARLEGITTRDMSARQRAEARRLLLRLERNLRAG